jgi:hypothetical protein
MSNKFAQPDVSLSDWKKFRKEASPFTFDKILDRHKARLPDWFLPFARGVAIPSYRLLHQIGYRRGMPRPHGWCESNDGFFRLGMGIGTKLIVRQCDDLDLWTVERWTGLLGNAELWGPEVDEVLVLNFGATPIFTREASAAMVLARHCHVTGPLPRLRWFKGPDNPEAVAEVVKQLRLNEAARSRPQSRGQSASASRASASLTR